MALNLLTDKGTPLDRQRFTWKELIQPRSASWTMTLSPECALF